MLVVHDVVKADQAAYTVVVGDKRSSATLSVEPTRFVIPLQDIQATEFDTLGRLDCTISNAKATTKWFKDGQVLETSSKYEIVEEGTARSLIVHDLKPEDVGSFSCVVGDVESVAQLNVEGKICCRMMAGIGYQCWDTTGHHSWPLLFSILFNVRH